MTVPIDEKFKTLFEYGGVNAVMRALKPRQRKFTEEYFVHSDGRKALAAAGYSTNYNTASNAMRKLLTHPGIVIVLREWNKAKAEKMIVDSAYVTHKWLKVIDRMENKPDDPRAAGVLLRASELLAKSLGMFVDKTEITGKDGEAIKVEEVQNAADAFARSIAGLAQRRGEDREALETKH